MIHSIIGVSATLMVVAYDHEVICYKCVCVCVCVCACACACVRMRTYVGIYPKKGKHMEIHNEIVISVSIMACAEIPALQHSHQCINQGFFLGVC